MAKDKGIAIKVDNVSKAFKLPHERQTTVKGLFVNMFRGRRTYERQQVLKDISFEIKKGEFYGIVGRNGSGKSTLLKLLAGIYTPDKGQVQVNGKLTPFIELGVGFNPELTGRENVFLNGALLGFSRYDMQDMYHSIVEFAELERFMDQKLKNYSSGMQVRLAFSIAIRSKADILVFDEVLAVGDAAFQQKSREYFAQLKQEKKTIVLVTHDMGAVRTFCDKGIVLEQGDIVLEGRNDKLSRYYEELFINEQNQRLASENKEKQTGHKSGSIDLKVAVYQSGKGTSVVDYQQPFEVVLDCRANKDLSNVNMGINIVNEAGAIVIATNLLSFNKVIPSLSKGQRAKISFVFEPLLSNGTYYINVAVEDRASQKLLFQEANSLKFKASGNTYNNHATVVPRHTLTLTVQ